MNQCGYGSLSLDLSVLATKDWWIFTAIIYTTLYAAACKSLKVPFYWQHSSINTVVEVAVDPGILVISNASNRDKVRRWISVLEKGIQCPPNMPLRSGNRADGAPIHEWAALHYELFSGASIEPSMRNSTDFRENIFGFSKHGILVIRDISLNPSLRPESLVEFHIQQGQPIEFPVDESGFIAGYSNTVFGQVDDDIEVDSDIDENDGVPFDPADLPKSAVLRRGLSDRKIRIDLEPCWDSDPRKVIFRVRVDGILKCNIYPRRVPLAIIKTFSDRERRSELYGVLSDVPCECDSPKNEIAVSTTESWRVMKISQLIDKVTSASEFDVVRFDKIEGGDRIFIPAGGDVGSQVLCAVCFPACKYYFCCPACGLAAMRNDLRWSETRKNWVLTMIV
jgi:hypothetical protein